MAMIKLNSHEKDFKKLDVILACRYFQERKHIFDKHVEVIRKYFTPNTNWKRKLFGFKRCNITTIRIETKAQYLTIRSQHCFLMSNCINKIPMSRMKLKFVVIFENFYWIFSPGGLFRINMSNLDLGKNQICIWLQFDLIYYWSLKCGEYLIVFLCSVYPL